MSSPMARLSPAMFPLRMQIHDEATGELLWERVITLKEAAGPARVEIPGFAEEGRTVRCETTDATGLVRIAASDGTVTSSFDPTWPPS